MRAGTARTRRRGVLPWAGLAMLHCPVAHAAQPSTPAHRWALAPRRRCWAAGVPTWGYKWIPGGRGQTGPVD
eukprot:14714602-Alexandrium_andersonii.AAC.1